MYKRPDQYTAVGLPNGYIKYSVKKKQILWNVFMEKIDNIATCQGVCPTHEQFMGVLSLLQLYRTALNCAVLHYILLPGIVLGPPLFQILTGFQVYCSKVTFESFVNENAGYLSH